MNKPSNKRIIGPAISRRSFVERLGLGAGAAVLAPIAATLVGEAKGMAQVGLRKRAVFFLVGDCFLPHHMSPPEFGDLTAPVMGGPTRFTLPPALAPLLPVRDRLLLIDGLANQVPRAQHSAGYAALSTITALNSGENDQGSPPGGITIDQFIANKIGGSTPLKSLLVAQANYNNPRGVFASGPGNPEAGYVDPQVMFDRVFSGLSSGPSTGGPSKDTIRNQYLMSTIRADITRLQKSLASSEKAKLDSYLALIGEYDERQRAQPATDCKGASGPPAGVTIKSARPELLDALFDQATLALACGLTNVVGTAVGCGQAHIFMKWPMIGHEGQAAMGGSVDTLSSMFARIMRMVKALQAIKEGDRTAFDNSMILFTSDNGGSNFVHHHTDKKRWPVVIVGNAGGALKADGRFVRYPAKGSPGSRALADLYSTVAHATGAPTDKFGANGVEPIKGPLTELLA